MPAPWPCTDDELAGADCLFDVDRVPRQPEVTEFKRRARRQQAWWREEQDLPIGSHTSGRPPAERTSGSRLELEHAQNSGANFLSDMIRSAVGERLAATEPHQTLSQTRLWSDLLSSMPMCFNLFGEAAADTDRLVATVDALWPNHPGSPSELRFEWSPSRRDPAFLNDRTAFDAALILELAGGQHGVIGIETKYHEHITRERKPDPETRLPRYREVAQRSEAFKPGWEDKLVGTDLQQIWRDHLLVLSMLQHPDAGWAWGSYVLVHPAANPSFAEAAQRYREVLEDDSTFEVRTIEELLDTHTLHPSEVEAAFRNRYLW